MQQIFSPAPAALRPLFDVPHLDFVIDAICAGNSPALVWVDNPDVPRSAFVWDKTHGLYVGGDADNPAFYDSLRQFLTQTMLPGARDRELGIFKIYPANEGWIAKIPALFDGLPLNTRERSLFRLKGDVTSQSLNLPDGCRLQPITRDLLEDSGHAHRLELVGEIESCWNSLDLFFTRGFGFCVVGQAGEIACWCTAEYVSGKTCGVGVQTVEAYLKRGLATAAAQTFAHHCAAHGWTAYWDCWRANVPSVKVAEKTGFRKVEDYPIFVAVLEG
jgi:hypothetical protein